MVVIVMRLFLFSKSSFYAFFVDVKNDNAVIGSIGSKKPFLNMHCVSHRKSAYVETVLSD